MTDIFKDKDSPVVYPDKMTADQRLLAVLVFLAVDLLRAKNEEYALGVIDNEFENWLRSSGLRP